MRSTGILPPLEKPEQPRWRATVSYQTGKYAGGSISQTHYLVDLDDLYNAVGIPPDEFAIKRIVITPVKRAEQK